MDSDDPQQPAVDKPAGQQLMRAREALGLSAKDVADAQHLRVSIIQAIEDGQYDQIESELFLKGYVRAYAKQVGADADAVIATLDRELEPLRRERAQKEQENPLADIERRRRKKRRMAKALLWLLVVGAISAAAWKLVIEPRIDGDLSVGEEQSLTGRGAEAEDKVVVPEADPVVVLGEGVTRDPEPEIVADNSIGTPDNATVENLPVLVDESTVVDALDDAPVLDESRNGGGDSPEPSEIVDAEPVVTPDPVFEESAQLESVVSLTELEMSFVSDCWVQVTDASGARLLGSLQRGGDRVNVSGRAPFNVVIGAVDAVDSISFGGEPVDLSSFRVVNNRTDFTLTL